jgi:hypothetical protein
MLDVNDFIKERGGDPEKIRESQRRRSAPVEAVDEVIALWEDHRKSMSRFPPLHADTHARKESGHHSMDMRFTGGNADHLTCSQLRCQSAQRKDQ